MNSSCATTFLHPYVRFINASHASDINFYMFNTLISANSQFCQVGKYIKCERGLTTFKVCENGSAKQLASLALPLEIGDVYTICAIGTDSNVSLYAVNEKVEKANNDHCHLRICNLYKCNESIIALSDNTCFAANIRYLDISKYIEFVPGKYKFEFKGCKSNKSFASCDAQTLKAGKYNSIYVLPPNINEKNSNCIFTIDSGSYSGFCL